MIDWLALTWPLERLGDSLAALAHTAKLSPQPAAAPLAPAHLAGDETALARWVETAVARLGFEAEPARIAYNKLPDFLRQAGPALFRLEEGATPRFLTLVRVWRKTAVILGPDYETHRVPLEAVRQVLCRDLEADQLPDIERMLAETAVSNRHCAKTRRFLLQEQLAAAFIDGCWLFDLAPGSSFRGQLRRAGLLRNGIVFTAVYTIQHFLFLLS